MENSQQEIKSLIEERVKAVQNKDPETAAKHYASDVLLFDVIGPLKQTGSVRKRLEEWFATFREEVHYEIAGLHITADENMAFCHGLHHVSATLQDGRQLDMWWRETLTWRKREGAWQITHAHSSVPFDANNGQASVGLMP